jgi:hypothetical protein
MLFRTNSSEISGVLVDLIARVEKGGGGGGVEKGLREEQILTFQALLFILFPHPFHKRQKLRQSQETSPKTNRNSHDARHILISTNLRQT